nr:unnamed protein product [Spirometra erinaceieuropaei]
MARVTDNGVSSEAFAMPSGVKQGCVLAPTLFSFMFSAILMDAYRDERPVIRITYRTDVHLLNSKHMKAPTRLSTTIVHDMLFANNFALNATTKEDEQPPPSRQPSQNTKSELESQDPQHGSPRTDRNPQHSRPVEATATTFAQPSCEDGR